MLLPTQPQGSRPRVPRPFLPRPHQFTKATHNTHIISNSYHHSISSSYRNQGRCHNQACHTHRPSHQGRSQDPVNARSYHPPGVYPAVANYLPITNLKAAIQVCL